MATLSRRLVSRRITWIPSVFCRNEGTSSTPPPASNKPPPKAESPTVKGPEPILNQTDNTKYQAEQVHHYNPMSFYDVEGEMDELRLKQPSNKVKFEPSV
ncbi:uncharacterized protein LOC110465512 [Mizuhopecten yessoensis]|uniref:uncharacterized protein LOC110465512 n=1 Tax=Mizuhopecten yessoensis TaxID=6573 RepID=UPI000B45AA08|nr:uncharacterized protein LOC110465512 [Mizuhopecten yessoensis]